MQKKLNKVARDTNTFLKNYLKDQKKTKLIHPIKYGLFPGGKKIRVKILVDIGKILSVPYKQVRISMCERMWMQDDEEIQQCESQEVQSK